MNDIRQLFERQAEWQKRRTRLSWAEKIRMAEALQATVRRMRASKPGGARSETRRGKIR